MEGAGSLVFGFILFCVMCVSGYFLKKYVQKFLETKMSEFWSSFLSDTILYTYVFAAAYLLAPLMGYRSFI